ncbi:hypothetical protein V6N13_118717 [Hibiscus sabdariffa]
MQSLVGHGSLSFVASYASLAVHCCLQLLIRREKQRAFQAEHNEENQLHDNGDGKSEDIGSSQDDDDNNDDANDNYANNEKEGGGAGNGRHITDGENSQILVCCVNDCLIAMHELCMNYKLDFDETEKFYCAYCWYKRVVARANELRRENLLAENNLLKFIHFKCDGGNKDGACNMKVASLSTTTWEKNSGDCENGLKDDTNDARKDIETTSDSENDGSDKDHWRKQSFDPNNFKILNDTLYLSIKGTFEITCALKDDQGKSRKEEPVLPNVVTLMTQEATSKVHAIESSLHRLVCGTLVVRQKHIKHAVQTAQP